MTVSIVHMPPERALKLPRLSWIETEQAKKFGFSGVLHQQIF